MLVATVPLATAVLAVLVLSRTGTIVIGRDRVIKEEEALAEDGSIRHGFSEPVVDGRNPEVVGKSYFAATVCVCHGSWMS